MTESPWIDADRAADILGIGRSSLRRLAREHPTRLGYRRKFGYRHSQVVALAKARGDVHPPTLVNRADAAALLGVGLDRFNQLVREHPTKLGRRRTARGYRTLYLRSAVVALKSAREGNRAPAYPRRGSALSVKDRGPQ